VVNYTYKHAGVAGLTEVIGGLSCNIAAMRGDVAKK